MSEELKPIKDSNINSSGYLDVGDGHKIYWVDWGDKSINNPIFYLHGGPGGGFDERAFDRFDPKTQRVIFHDQRGSSRSKPFASIKNNTTQELVDDINKLRDHLSIDKLSLYGFSWGSTLALVYAIQNPKVVEKMLIGGIFLARQSDADFLLNGLTATHFPEVWKEFSALVPKSAKSVSEFYKDKMFNGTPAEKKKFVKAWMINESSLVTMYYQPEKIKRELKDFASESIAYLEAHYILNDCFIEDNYILKNANKIKGIKTVIVHGRFDFVCMPSAAIELHEAMGKKPVLHMPSAGHATSEPMYKEVIKAYINMLWG